MHERRSDRSGAVAEDKQLNIYKAEGQIAFVIIPKCPPTVSELHRNDASKTVKQVFCFIPVISEGHQACQVTGFLLIYNNSHFSVCFCVWPHTCYILVPNYSFCQQSEDIGY